MLLLKSLIFNLRVCQHKPLQPDRKLDIARANLCKLVCNDGQIVIKEHISCSKSGEKKTYHILNFEILELGWESKLLHNPRILPCSQPTKDITTICNLHAFLVQT